MGIDENTNINVYPKWMWNVANYRSTLAHKMNHHFLHQNIKYKVIWHPRFGIISSGKTVNKIYPHDELIVSYNYIPQIGTKYCIS